MVPFEMYILSVTPWLMSKLHEHLKTLTTQNASVFGGPLRIPFSIPTPTDRSIRHGRRGELLTVIRQTSKVSVQNQLRHANCPLHARKTNSDNHPTTDTLETTSSPPPSLPTTALLLIKTCYPYCHYRKWMARRFVNGHHRDLQTIFKNNKSCHEMSTS